MPGDWDKAGPRGKVPVYILAGGKSSRFGSDKARADMNGIPLLVRVAEMLRPVACRLIVVADSKDKYRDLGLTTIADIQSGLGPLGGILTALTHHGSNGWLLCATSDRLGIQLEWLHALLAARQPNAIVVAFRGRFWQPFPALYHGLLTSKIHQAMATGCSTPWRLIQQIHAVALRLPAEWKRSIDINDTYALRRWHDHG